MNATISMTNKLRGTVSMANSKINGGASPYPKGASGSIITITDGAENTPLKSCVVNIEPAQDLHGYDYPWPAGGGKNLFYRGTDQTNTLNGVTGTFDAETQTISVVGTNTSSSAYVLLNIECTGDIPREVALARTLFNAPSGVYINLVYRKNGSWVSVNNGDSIPAEIDSTVNLQIGLYGSATSINADNIKAQIELGSTATAYAPYSNICPISGWSEVKVWVKPTYDTSLTPTATISLGRTVYGGMLDVLRGKLVVDKYLYVYDGTEAFSKSGTALNGFYNTLVGTNLPHGWPAMADYNYISAITDEASSMMMQTKDVNTYKQNYGYVYFDSGHNFNVPPEEFGTTVASFKAKLASLYADGTPLTVFCKLATPQEYNLTPQTIRTLLGTNNIWADAGEMSIEYYPAAASIVAVQNRSTKAYVSIPLGMIRYETYQITPQQTIDLDSYRSENGNLLRNPVATKCKLEFNTPLMTDTQWAEIWNIIKAGFNNNTERKLKLKYYDTLSASYKTGYFYVPDVQTTIRNIDEATGTINYNEIRLAFIEY